MAQDVWATVRRELRERAPDEVVAGVRRARQALGRTTTGPAPLPASSGPGPVGPDRFDFVDRYNAHASWALDAFEDRGAALAFAIGSDSRENFDTIGLMQEDLLVAHGLTEDSSLVELGCGVGRLAVHLAGWLRGSYLGVDVVPELLDRAAVLAEGPAMRFERVTGLAVPVPEASIDMVCAFSVFTHLLHEESITYLADCWRALKPGGKVVFSFLEFRVPSHWAVMEGNLAALGTSAGVLNQFMSADAVEVWAEHLGFRVDEVFRGDEPYIPLRRPLRLNEELQEGMGTFGQSATVWTKPEAA